jgi:hypothetical protein
VAWTGGILGGILSKREAELHEFQRGSTVRSISSSPVLNQTSLDRMWTPSGFGANSSYLDVRDTFQENSERQPHPTSTRN